MSDEKKVKTIYDELAEGKALDTNVAKEAAEKIAKRNKERKVEEMEKLIQRDSYLRGKSLCQLQHARAKSNAQKDMLTRQTELSEALNAGKHDSISYEAAFNENMKKYREDLRKAAKDFDEAVTRLKSQFNEFYTWSWDNLLDF